MNLQAILDHFVLASSQISFLKKTFMMHSSKTVEILFRPDETELKTALNKQAKNSPCIPA